MEPLLPEFGPAPPALPQRSAVRQLVLPLGLGTASSFDDFVVGANRHAWDHLREGDLSAAPIFIWGERGTGKTHLLAAAAQRLARSGGRVTWLAGMQQALHEDAPAADGSLALDPGTVDAPAILVVDDCDRMSASQQHAAFALLAQAGPPSATVLAASRFPPVDLPVREDLRTRLAQGLVFRLEPLDEAGMRQALSARAARLGMTLSDEVAAYLLTRFTRDLRSLMDLLHRLDHYGLSLQRPLTVPLVRQMVEEKG